MVAAAYGGGLLLPLRDGTSGRPGDDGQSSYGGGDALHTAKGADLGGRDGHLVVDLNFLYHPSCRYNDAWQCPLAPTGEHDQCPGRGRRATSSRAPPPPPPL